MEIFDRVKGQNVTVGKIEHLMLGRYLLSKQDNNSVQLNDIVFDEQESIYAVPDEEGNCVFEGKPFPIRQECIPYERMRKILKSKQAEYDNSQNNDKSDISPLPVEFEDVIYSLPQKLDRELR